MHGFKPSPHGYERRAGLIPHYVFEIEARTHYAGTNRLIPPLDDELLAPVVSLLAQLGVFLAELGDFILRGVKVFHCFIRHLVIPRVPAESARAFA